MRDDQWLEAYKAGRADAEAKIVAFLRLASSMGHRIADLEGIAVRVERGDYLK